LFHCHAVILISRFWSNLERNCHIFLSVGTFGRSTFNALPGILGQMRVLVGFHRQHGSQKKIVRNFFIFCVAGCWGGQKKPETNFTNQGNNAFGWDPNYILDMTWNCNTRRTFF
jgi:hypothetical protein